MLSFANAPGNLFNRLGKLGKIISQIQTYQLAQYQNLVNPTTGAYPQFVSEPDIQSLIGSQFLSQLSGPESVSSLCQQVAQQIINRMVFRDNPQISQTLSQLNILTSINEVIRQMNVQGATVLQQTITATPSTYTGTGTGGIAVCVKRASDGRSLEHCLAETLLVTCTSDSYLGGTTAGAESFTITGTGAETDLFAWDFPMGSNSSNTVTQVLSSDSQNASGNLLNNSNFATWSTVTNFPTNWDILSGVAGTSLVKETANTYGSGYAVRIVGDGSSTPSFSQTFNNGTTGTGIQLPAQYVMGWCVFLRSTTGADSTGTLTVDLVDVNNAVVYDNAGNLNSKSISLTTLGTSYTAFSGYFLTPTVLPSTLKFRISASSAPGVGDDVLIANLSATTMTQLYNYGPYVSLHYGSTPFIQGDFATIPVTNSRGSGGTLNTFQTLFMRLFDPYVLNNNIILPSSSMPTISDNLMS
jgi:hypothetical protein